MYEHEEKKLSETKQELQEASIPHHRLDDAILAGIRKGKRASKKNQAARAWVASAAVVLILVVFAGSLRMSTDFARLVSGMPGMEKIVELVRMDKGLLSSIENDYVQKAGASDEHHGITITLDSFIVDEEQLVLFYSFESADRALEEVHSSRIDLQTEEGDKVPVTSLSYGGEDLENKKGLYSATIGLKQPLKEQDYQFVLHLEEGEKELSGEWKIPFKVDRDKIGKTRTVRIDETFTIEGQEIHVGEVRVAPTRTAVSFEFPQSNSMRIFNIEDLRLVDEHGETWSKISNGVVASGDSDKITYYLQSNYFENPEELYLAFDSIRALDKDHLEVVVDPAEEKVLKAPDGRLASVKVEDDVLLFAWDKYYRQADELNPFNSYVDADGKKHDLSSFIMTGDHQFGFPYSKNDGPSPITFELKDYPSWIKGNIKIPLQ
ncbi:DUF4179 domain-containing protein [Rossellomorea aquimaris]|uniref:DUF4179 domain-containing protein n=1 Tax=Rossellomorea aquimaris TaxID=189382 RepID=UPI001CD697F0|nr:DUF4179 domain-containing protein [Rossellomorea aquimaris]MCA1055651.1 DUF4179 domain-containing protein [Rossellomorea aquimaris]